MHKTLLSSAAIVVLMFGAHSAIPQMPFSSEVPDNAQTTRSMVDNIKDTGDVPSDPGVIYTEITNAKQQYEYYKSFRSTIHLEDIQNEKLTFHNSLQGLNSLAQECNTKKNDSSIQLVRTKLSEFGGGYYFQYQSRNATAVSGELQKLVNLPSIQLCAKLLDTSEISSLEKAEDQDIDARKAAATVRLQSAADLGDAWKTRYENLQKISKKSSETTLLRITLLVVVGVVCVFAWLIFKGVSSFDVGLQTELVTSGQLIQFPTVMILLVVVVVLGLSGILDDKTLGALLGGIAGYVLSQGVGQSASRQALRAAAQGSQGGQLPLDPVPVPPAPVPPAPVPPAPVPVPPAPVPPAPVA